MYKKWKEIVIVIIRRKNRRKTEPNKFLSCWIPHLQMYLFQYPRLAT